MYRKLVVDKRIKARHSELIENPVIINVNKFNDDAVKRFREQMEKAHQTGQPCIPILINSYGGSAYNCLDMINVIHNSKIPVHTIVTGKAMSAGAILFSAGQNRYMSPLATLMFHNVYYPSKSKKNNPQELNRLNKLIFGLIAQNTKQPKDYFATIMDKKGNKDWFLTAKTAKKHNLCTHIHVPEMTVKININYLFE